MSLLLLFLVWDYVLPFLLLCLLSWWVPKKIASWSWVHSDRQGFWMVIAMALPALFSIGVVLFAIADELGARWHGMDRVDGSMAFFIAVLVTIEIWGPIAISATKRALAIQRDKSGGTDPMEAGHAAAD